MDSSDSVDSLLISTPLTSGLREEGGGRAVSRRCSSDGPVLRHANSPGSPREFISRHVAVLNHRPGWSGPSVENASPLGTLPRDASVRGNLVMATLPIGPPGPLRIPVSVWTARVEFRRSLMPSHACAGITVRDGSIMGKRAFVRSKPVLGSRSELDRGSSVTRGARFWARHACGTCGSPCQAIPGLERTGVPPCHRALVSTRGIVVRRHDRPRDSHGPLSSLAVRRGYVHTGWSSLPVDPPGVKRHEVKPLAAGPWSSAGRQVPLVFRNEVVSPRVTGTLPRGNGAAEGARGSWWDQTPHGSRSCLATRQRHVR